VFVTTEPFEAYKALLDRDKIDPDPAQFLAMSKLQNLHKRLEDYGRQMGRTGWRARLSIRARRMEPPKGVYIWGGVGRGKSMLMDLFFEHVHVDEAEKKHVHFHAFMQEVHRRVHSFREAQKAGKVAEDKDPLVALAKVIVDQAWLLCFDEFHVTDIADAMILGRLFEALFEQGVVIVATSNRHPRDRYKDGLQRERFMPFIDLIMERMEVLELDAERDYRLERLKGMDVYVTPDDAAAERKLDGDFRDLTLGATPHRRTVRVNGRDIEFPQAAEGVALTTFDDLCRKPLGPGDYLEIARQFHTVIMKHIPQMGPEMRNEAKRFVTLIDALYEGKVNLICSAAVPPEQLYPAGDGAFEFERTVSRLMEMQSRDYLEAGHAEDFDLSVEETEDLNELMT
jgi:cell division protein ZapE